MKGSISCHKNSWRIVPGVRWIQLTSYRISVRDILVYVLCPRTQKLWHPSRVFVFKAFLKIVLGQISLQNVRNLTLLGASPCLPRMGPLDHMNYNSPYPVQPWRWRHHVCPISRQHFHYHAAKIPKSRTYINSELPLNPKISIPNIL
jgi:hypothetical protein